MQKVGRNDPCTCGSGKKFKKCCEHKIKHKKFEAEVLSEEAQPKKLTSLFQRKVTPPSAQPASEPTEPEEKNVVM